MPNDIISRLKQEEIELWFCNRYGADLWTTVYLGGNHGTDHIALFSYLLSEEDWARHCDNPGWYFNPEAGTPGFVQENEDGQEVISYLRYGTDESFEPIIILRTFPNHRENYLEIVEELRHMFNLYEVRGSGIFLLIDDNGDEHEVIRVTEDKVEMNTVLLNRYLAVKQKLLVLAIDSYIYSDLAPCEDITLPENREIHDSDLCLYFGTGTTFDGRIFSRLFGKKCIYPPEIEICGIEPYGEPKEYVNYIICEDKQGLPVENTSNDKYLSDNFGGNAGAPHYLTPVFFKREVLRKYYENHERYSVEDGFVRQHGIWSLQIDNDSEYHVVVFLGDLGRDLPTEEQRYWRGFNIIPGENRMSETSIRRSFLSQWARPTSPEHLFKQSYLQINDVWLDYFGWPLLREPHKDDRHNFSRLRVPLENDFGEFDVQILNLTKILIDLLNEEEISKALVSPPDADKGIDKLEQLLKECGYPDVNRDIGLLRTIQRLRSTGSVHCKSSDYDITKADLNPEDLQGSFAELLDRTAQMLERLMSFIRDKGKLEGNP